LYKNKYSALGKSKSRIKLDKLVILDKLFYRLKRDMPVARKNFDKV
jgi:hypothetical protein